MIENWKRQRDMKRGIDGKREREIERGKGRSREKERRATQQLYNTSKIEYHFTVKGNAMSHFNEHLVHRVALCIFIV